MDPEELKNIRQELGLTLRGLANALGMNGKNSPRILRRYENGQKPIPESMRDRLDKLLEDL